MSTNINIDVDEWKDGTTSVTITEHNATGVTYNVGKISSDNELIDCICERLHDYLSYEDE